MKIIYNPKDGAPITSFISKGTLLDPHYPEGFEMPNGKQSNGLIQYDDVAAQELLETYQFLSELTSEQAQAKLSSPTEEYKCDFPGCDFSSTAKIGLAGHKKKHQRELDEAQKPIADVNLIPVARGRKLQVEKPKEAIQADAKDIANGRDADGVDWYGAGVQVENKSSDFGQVRPKGQGHF